MILIDEMAKDIFDKMTKQEIVAWIRSTVMYISSPPRMSDLMFVRWQQQSGKLQIKRRNHIESFKSLGLKKRDVYAKQFNQSTDINEKLKLMNKIQPLDNKVQKHHEEYKKLEREQKKVDRLYKAIDKAREEE